MADAAAELDEGGVKRALKDLFAGAAGGVAQVLIGQFVISEFIRYLPIAFGYLCFIASSLHAAFCLIFLGENMGEKLTSCNIQDSHSVGSSHIIQGFKESILSHAVQILSKFAFKQPLDTPAP